MTNAIFIDRDGVIVHNRSDYVRRVEDAVFLPGALATLAKFARLPVKIFIVSNQACVGRGLLTLTDAEDIMAHIVAEIARAGGRITAAYLCPHHPDRNCLCRKPRPGMLMRAAAEHGIDLTHSVMVGDMVSDIMAARAVHATPVKIGAAMDDVPCFASLADAAEYIAQVVTSGIS